MRAPTVLEMDLMARCERINAHLAETARALAAERREHGATRERLALAERVIDVLADDRAELPAFVVAVSVVAG